MASPDKSRLQPAPSYWERLAREYAATYPGSDQPWMDQQTGAVFEHSPYSVPDAEYTAAQYYGEDPMDPLTFGNLGPSAMEGQAANPWAVQAQWDALTGIRDIVNQGGLTAVDRARMAEARSQEDAYLRGQHEATLADLQARGMAGGGQELLASMMAQQGAGQRMSAADLETEAMAQERHDKALRDAFEASSGLRKNQWDEQAQIAAARDAVNKTNWAASNVAKTATWEGERDRRMREAQGRTALGQAEAARKTDYSTWAHEEPFRRHAERFGMTTGGQGVQSTNQNAQTGWMNAGTARMNADAANGPTAQIGQFFGSMFGRGQ